MSTLKVNNISNTGGTKSATTDDIADGRCRAWVNFNGIGTNGTNMTIRASFNVSSVYKNGAGDFTINFTNAMPDANYCVVTSSASAQAIVKTVDAFGGEGTDPTTTSVRVFNRSGSNSAQSRAHVYVAIFR